MNKDNAKDYLPLVQALAEGKTIQRYHASGVWSDVDYLDGEITPVSHYRIKPEPRRAWVWWPPADKAWKCDPAIRSTRDSAESLIAELGGHITEVTE